MLIVSLALNPPKTFEQAIPLMLLLTVLGLPAVLILLTTRKVIYVLWMFIYLAALPVWNFILPVYAFWHFDDFSWGETRYVDLLIIFSPSNKLLNRMFSAERVDGDGQGDGHGGGEGTTIDTTVPLRRWEDWERSRLRKLKREEKRKREMERFHGGLRTGDGEFFAPTSSGEHVRRFRHRLHYLYGR